MHYDIFTGHLDFFCSKCTSIYMEHDDVIKWKHFPCYWPFVRGIHRSPVSSPHKGQWRGALIFSLICVWINGWVNNGEAGDLRRHRAHYDVSVMKYARRVTFAIWWLWLCIISYVPLRNLSSYEISFVFYTHFISPFVFKFCTEQHIITVVVCAKFQTNLAIEK